MESRKFAQLSQFLNLVNTATKLYKDSLKESLALSSIRIGTEQAQILIFLDAAQGRSQLSMAKSLKKDPASISRMLSALEKRSLVQKKKLAKTQKIYLTPEGIDLLQKIKPIYQKHMIQFFSNIHDKEMHIMQELIQRLGS